MLNKNSHIWIRSLQLLVKLELKGIKIFFPLTISKYPLTFPPRRHGHIYSFVAVIGISESCNMFILRLSFMYYNELRWQIPSVSCSRSFFVTESTTNLKCILSSVSELWHTGLDIAYNTFYCRIMAFLKSSHDYCNASLR